MSLQRILSNLDCAVVVLLFGGSSDSARLCCCCCYFRLQGSLNLALSQRDAVIERHIEWLQDQQLNEFVFAHHILPSLQQLEPDSD